MTKDTTQLYEHRLDELQTQLEHIAENEFYDGLYAEHGVDPVSVSSLSDFQRLPFITAEDLGDAFANEAGRGPFYSEQVNRSYVTPYKNGLMPLFYTDQDWDRLTTLIARRFEGIGLGPSDFVLNTIGYTPFIAGQLFHDAISKTGAVPVAAGAGDSESAANLANLYDVTAATGFPSYIEKVATQADLALDTLICAGEPLIYYPERREEIREAVGGAETVVDVYGLAEAGTVAAEDDSEDGMHVFDEEYLLEVIDPESGEAVAPGEIGEVVLTSLHQEATPIVRFRTGDITKLGYDGEAIKLPEGVFGRVDNRLKVKGVKVYPGAIEPVLGQFAGLTGDYTVEVTTTSSGTDRMSLSVQAETDTDVNIGELQDRIQRQIHMSVDQLNLVEKLEHDDVVVDRRSESIT